jgi:hypothetical protein
VKRLWILILALAMLCLAGASAMGDLPWPDAPTRGQTRLAAYVDVLNENLLSLGEAPVNSLFECWPALAVFGMTAQDNAEAPEQEGDIQFTVYLSAESPDYLEFEMTEGPEIRTDGTVVKRYPERFPVICAAMIRAAAPGSMSAEDARAVADACMKRIRRDPEHSFADAVSLLKGEAPQVYFAYEIDAYGEMGAVALRMTLVFPVPDSDMPVQSTPEPAPYTEVVPFNEDGDPNWDGYFPNLDDASHFDIFVTPTPEPDSAVFPY